MLCLSRHHPTNEPGSYLWCGCKLRVTSKYRDNRDDKVQDVKRGAYGDGYFCSLVCGHAFAVAMAEFGHRCKPTK